MGRVGWVVWVVVTCLGWILASAGTLARAIVFGGASAPVLALVLLQWAALRQWIPGAWWWIPATLAGRIMGPPVASAFFAVMDLAVSRRGPRTLVEVIVGFAIIGAVIGAMQWLVLRRTLPRAGWWVAASTLAWASAEITAAGAADLVDGLANLTGPAAWYAAFWTTNGLVHGVVTGTALLWISRHAGRVAASTAAASLRP